jgi:hypothetical protein
MSKKRTFSNVRGLLGHTFDLDYFHPNKAGKTAIPYLWVPGTTPLVVVLGENASGKSFFRRIVSLLCKEVEVERITLSMEGRRSDYLGALRAFVYGSEEWQSTGENSSNTVTTGISTCRSRETRHIIFWDEPDLGLSDSWAAGMGAAIRDFAENPGKHTVAAFVVTHNRYLVRELLSANPHYVHLGEPAKTAPATLAAWLEKPVKARPIEELAKESHRRFKAIQVILDGLKSAKEEAEGE